MTLWPLVIKMDRREKKGKDSGYTQNTIQTCFKMKSVIAKNTSGSPSFFLNEVLKNSISLTGIYLWHKLPAFPLEIPLDGLSISNQI